MAKVKRSQKRKRASADNYIDPDRKPAMLDPELPHYDSDYYGPPPDAGFTYGNYNCDACGASAYHAKGEEMHCPSCGAIYTAMPNEPEEEEIEMIQAASSSGTCGECYSELYSTDSAYAGNDEKYCPQCGGQLNANAGLSNSDEVKEIMKEDGYHEEYLQDPDSFQEPLLESNLDLDLYHKETANPHWNLNVDGNPVAKICLQDQNNPEEYRPAFIDDSYGKNTALAIAKVGIKKVLSALRARVYATKLSSSKYAEEIQAKVHQAEDKKYRKLRATANENLKTCINITLAGMNKNFFPELTNHLKHSLFTGMQSVGVVDPQPIIEEAFRTQANKFFDTVLKKSNELMEEEPKVLSALASAISRVNISTDTSDASVAESANAQLKDQEDEMTLAERLAQGSFPLSFGTGINEETEIQNSKATSALKAKLSLGKRL